MERGAKQKTGFTIVELLIVIVVIGILAALVISTFSGAQQRAREARLQSAIKNAETQLKRYHAENGFYPKTADYLYVDYNTNLARTDANCPYGSKSTDWIPSLTQLPQSPQDSTGARGYAGCYMYVSDGTYYVLSAWNLLENPQTSTFYRRLGFRETPIGNQFYLCNHSSIGGVISGAYNAANDFYKYSYTFTNIPSCNEAPPAGA